MTDLSKRAEAYLALADAATPGPWKYVPWHIAEGNSQVRVAGDRAHWLICEVSSDETAAFIAASPEAAAIIRGFQQERERMQEEITRLQAALAFWLPSVPEKECESRDRIANDAFLLHGYDGPTEQGAESLGWIALTTPCPEQAQRIAELEAESARLRADAGRYRWLRDRVDPNTDTKLLADFYGGYCDEADATIDAAIKQEPSNG